MQTGGGHTHAGGHDAEKGEAAAQTRGGDIEMGGPRRRYGEGHQADIGGTIERVSEHDARGRA